jgi:branched-chain amino acid transport system substrate-binding protein
MSSMIWRGVTGTTRFKPLENAAYTYPTETNDSSLGMPHQFLQIHDYTKGPGLIAPFPYGATKFMMPPWIKA